MTAGLAAVNAGREASGCGDQGGEGRHIWGGGGRVPASLGDEQCVRQGRQTVTEAEGGVCSEEVRGTYAEPLGWTELCVTLGGIERRMMF